MSFTKPTVSKSIFQGWWPGSVPYIYIYTQKEQLKPNSKASTQDLEQSILFASVVNCAIISRVKDGKDALLNWNAIAIATLLRKIRLQTPIQSKPNVCSIEERRSKSI